VSLKTFFELLRDRLDLHGHLGEDPHRGANDVAVGSSQDLGRLQLRAAKGTPDLLGPLGDAPVPSCSLQDGSDPGAGKRATLRRRGCHLEHGQGIWRGQVSAEGLERRRVELPKARCGAG
jgi:hypothetical protein